MMSWISKQLIKFVLFLKITRIIVLTALPYPRSLIANKYTNKNENKTPPRKRVISFFLSPVFSPAPTTEFSETASEKKVFYIYFIITTLRHWQNMYVQLEKEVTEQYNHTPQEIFPHRWLIGLPC